MLPIEGVISSFFFKAMVAGWVAGGQKIKITKMPGYKAIPFRDNGFNGLYLLDCWCVGRDSQKSAGTTTIWDKDIPVWLMNYAGHYEERAVPFVKRALQQAYEANRFIGGRGPYVHREGGLIYINQPHPGSSFLKFEGREEVFDIRVKDMPGHTGLIGQSLGWHEYWGMSLL